jgi:hypothetical protein
MGRVHELLEEYKQRLAVRLGTAIEANWLQFLPYFNDHVLETIRQKLPTTTSTATEPETFYPEGTKYFWRSGDSCYLVLEQKPQVRTMHFETRGDKRIVCANKDRYRLAFPYVVFVVGLARNPEHGEAENAWYFRVAYCGFSKRSVRTVHDFIYTPNIPNVHGHAVCCGVNYEQKRGTIAEQAERLVSHFWQGTFTKDWSEDFVAMQSLCPTYFSTLEKWEEWSVRNPLFQTTVDWPGGTEINRLLSLAAGKNNKDAICTLDSYCRAMVTEASKKAREDIARAFAGVDTEALDDKFCADLMSLLEPEKEKVT